MENNQKKSKAKHLFKIHIPDEYFEEASDWGGKKGIYSYSVNTKLSFLGFVEKIQLLLYLVIFLLGSACIISFFVLMFGTQFERAYADDGSAHVCKIL